MARGRMLSKSLSTSKKYAQLYASGDLGLQCQALYPLLVAHSDDFGRLEGDVFTIQNSVVPASKWPETVVEAVLARLHEVELVVWYQVGGALFLQIVDFERHQVGLHKRTKSRFPRVPGNSRKLRGVPLQLNRTEQNRTELNRTTSSPADAGRQKSAPEERRSENLRIITKLCHEALSLVSPGSEDGEIRDAVKSLCAIRSIDYDSATVNRALESALAQRRAKQAVAS